MIDYNITNSSNSRWIWGIVIHSDASGRGLGCVLMQQDRVISFASRQLKPHETNYLIYNLELAIVIITHKVWRHYLLGERVEIFTDHKSLKFIFTQKELNRARGDGQSSWQAMI